MRAAEVSDLHLLTFPRRLTKTDYRRFDAAECFDYRRSVRREHRYLTRVVKKSFRVLLVTIGKVQKIEDFVNELFQLIFEKYIIFGIYQS